MNMLLKERNTKIRDELTDVNHQIDITKTNYILSFHGNGNNSEKDWFKKIGKSGKFDN